MQYSGSDDLESGATDIYVDATGVYVTGYIRKSTKSTAVLWKNAVSVSLSNPEVYTEAKALFVHNSDLYVCGYQVDINDYKFKGKIWKNGFLIGEITDGKLESVYIKGNEIFVAGFGLNTTKINQEAKIWKSNLNNINFIEEYKFPSDEIKAIVVK